MNFVLLLRLAEVFGLLSLVAFGGVNAQLPEVHRQVVEVHGWMNDAMFSEIFAISNAAPGPNVLLVSLIGWQVSGLSGLAMTTLAQVTPSCLVTFSVSRLMRRYEGRRWIALLREGLVPVALGLISASGVAMMRAADTNLLLVGMSLATAVFVVFSTRNPLWAFGAVTLAGVAAQRFGWM